MRKIFIKISLLICSCFVAICTLCITIGNKDKILTPIRDVELQEQNVDYQSVLENFEGGMLEQEGYFVTFEGTQQLNLKEYQFLDNLSKFDIESLNNISVLYKFSYDYENDIIYLSATMTNEDANIETDTISGSAFLNDNGEIDAVMDIDGEYVLLSEMKKAGMIENCGWFTRLVKSVVKVSVVTVSSVAIASAIVGTAGKGAIAVIGIVGTLTCAISTTQTVRANINYSNNKKVDLHDDINSDGYITDQSKYSDWSFGFATLDKVGCEVIAVYNTMISLGKRKELYDVIYDFEMLNIDIDLGFGYLGSNPMQIYRYFVKQKMSYVAFSSINDLENVASKFGECKIIFTSYNSYSISGIHSLHTFVIIKNNNGKYYCYNGYAKNFGKTYNNLSEFIEYSFNYAYIVY